MSRNVVAIVSSVCFVILAALLVVIPVPYVTWRPGQSVDMLTDTDDGPVLEITGVESHPTTGKLVMLTVSTTQVDARVSLPEALIAHLAPNADAMPREAIYKAGSSDEEVKQQSVALMNDSRTDAAVAAMRAAAISVTELPQVASVTLQGPAVDLLQPGDFILKVNGVDMIDAKAVADAIKAGTVNEDIAFTVLRGGKQVPVTVRPLASPTDGKPYVGITVDRGFQYAPTFTYRVDSDIVGPSAGLAFALAIYDKISGDDLTGGATVAATGEITPDKVVKDIGGIQEKVKSAERAGAETVFFPQGNCDEIAGVDTSMRLVPVSTLDEALAALRLIKQGTTEGVPSCEPS